MRLASVLRVVAVAALLLMAGCSSKNKGKIEGTKWSSLVATAKGTTIPAGFLQLTFGKDGSLSYQVGPQNFSGTYSLGMGTNVTLNFNQDVVGRKKHVEKIAISGNQLTMTDSDGTQVSFQQVK
jgi:hypothetical protein